MKWNPLRTMAVGAMLVLMQITGAAQEPAARPDIEPTADEQLREMCALMNGSRNLTMRLTDSIDNVLVNGQKIQFTHLRSLTFVRPNLLKVETSGDVVNRVLWKDSQMLTVLDPGRNVYARLDLKDTVDQAIEVLRRRLQISLPGSDLLSDDLYKVLTENAVRIQYYGLGYVGEQKCHHLVFQGNNIDWQLWIDSGQKKWPRKLVITYKNDPGQPQYSMYVLDIQAPATIDESIFNYKIPSQAKQVEVEFVKQQE